MKVFLAATNILFSRKRICASSYPTAYFARLVWGGGNKLIKFTGKFIFSDKKPSVFF